MAVVVNGHYEGSGHYGLRVAWASIVNCDLHPSSSISYDLMSIADYLTSIADYLTSIAETQRGWPRGAIPLFGFPEDSALRRNPPLHLVCLGFVCLGFVCLGFVCLGFVCLGSVSRVQAAFRLDRSL